MGNRNYLGKQWASLSANPSNDIKDMESLLRRGGYATENTYENVSSAENFEEILRSYIDVVNKEAESIDIVLFYFAGYGLVGEPEKLRAKKAFKIFTDREESCVEGLQLWSTLFSYPGPQEHAAGVYLDNDGIYVCGGAPPTQPYQTSCQYHQSPDLQWTKIDYNSPANR